MQKVQEQSLTEIFAQIRIVQKALIDSYLADVAKHSGKINSMHIDRLWRSVPEQLARSHDLSTSKFKFKDAVPGVNGYQRLAGPIDWLLKAGLIIKIPINYKSQEPLMAYTKENMFKLFMFDVGILGALADLDPSILYQYDYGTFKGYFAENYVAQELRASGYDRVYAWHEATAEIEFLLQGRLGIVPVEVKSGNRTKAQSLRVYTEKYKPKRKVILSAKPPYSDPQNNTDFI
jgi:uncharacterized protein